jgi:hypothetical protein
MDRIGRVRPPGELGQRAAPDLFVHLGQFPADDRGTVVAV